MNAAAIQAAHSLINMNTPDPARINKMILQRRRDLKTKLVLDWLTTLPTHWKVEIDISGDAGGGEVVSDESHVREDEGRPTKDNHGRIKTNLEQKVKLVMLDLPLRKRKGVFDDEIQVMVGDSANVAAEVKVEETKKETVMARPIKRVKRLRRDVVVITS